MTRATPIPDTITLHVPFSIAKRGGRKEVILPANAPVQRSRVDNTLVKALARAFRWKRMLESDEFTTVGDLAKHEGIAPSYMTRVLRMKDDETPWPQQIQERDKRRERNRNIDRAERLYRYIIFRRRRYRGAPVRGARSELIPRIAGLCKIDPRQLRSRLHK